MAVMAPDLATTVTDLATTAPSDLSSNGQQGADEKAIARWDVVPDQVITGQLTVGVVAYHMAGIDHVDFTANGAPLARASTPVLNSETNVVEYTATVRASDFPDGRIELHATAYPTVGVPRALQGVDSTANGEHSLYLWTNANGSLTPSGASATVYVASSGNDSNSGSAANPLATLRRALTVVADGGTIVIATPGAYTGIDSPVDRPAQPSRWITIKPAPGIAATDVTITNTTATIIRPAIDKLHWVGVSFDYANVIQYYREDDQEVWFDQTRWFDSLGWLHTGDSMTPVRTLMYGGKSYVTDALAENMVQGFVEVSLVRNSRMQNISGDALQNSRLVLNDTVDNLGGTILTWHADLLQYFGNLDNIIVDHVTATNVNGAQNFFLDPYQSVFKNMIFTDVSVTNTQDPAQPPFTQMNSFEEHVIFSRVSNPGQGWMFRTDASGTSQFIAKNWIMKDCAIDQFFGIDTLSQYPAGVTVSGTTFRVAAPR
jgi:hypothetical protein